MTMQSSENGNTAQIDIRWVPRCRKNRNDSSHPPSCACPPSPPKGLQDSSANTKTKNTDSIMNRDICLSPERRVRGSLNIKNKDNCLSPERLPRASILHCPASLSCSSSTESHGKAMMSQQQEQIVKRPKWQLSPHTERKPRQRRRHSLPQLPFSRQHSLSSFVMPNDIEELFQDDEMVPHYAFEYPALIKTAHFKEWAKKNTQRASLIMGMYMRADRGDEHLPSGINCCGYCLRGHHPMTKLPVCPGCLKTQYCNRQCQQKHWMFHKKYCQSCV